MYMSIDVIDKEDFANFCKVNEIFVNSIKEIDTGCYQFNIIVDEYESALKLFDYYFKSNN